MNTEELKTKIEQIDKEIFKIFCMVCDEKEISAYKNHLLNAKLQILESSLQTTLITLLNKETIYLNNIVKYQKLLTLILIVAFILIFINPLLGVGSSILCWILKYRLNTNAEEKITSFGDIDSLMSKVSGMETTIQNCYTFLNAHTNYDLEYREEELDNEELRKVDLANEHIEIAVMNGGIGEIPEEIQSMMVSMLQMDLETDEKDLEKLMQMAIKKEIEKSIGHSDEMTRIRTKNDKNSEK